jgi:hypothetical protein
MHYSFQLFLAVFSFASDSSAHRRDVSFLYPRQCSRPSYEESPCNLPVSRLMYEISRISFSPLSLIISYVTRDHENYVYPLPLPAPVKRPDVNIKLCRSLVTLLLDIPFRGFPVNHLATQAVKPDGTLCTEISAGVSVYVYVREPESY